MKIICLVKVIPDVEHFTYDYENNILVRENKKSIVNLDDACALAAALQLKERRGANVDIISMGPESNRKYLEDLIRRGADRAILISDSLYRGSDTYVTSKILAKCIERDSFDMIFCGSHSMDGDTAHVPSQIAELLGINVISNIVKVTEDESMYMGMRAEVADDEKRMLFAVKLPAVFGIAKESKYKLPFVRYDDRKKDVSGQVSVLTNQDLGFCEKETGLTGSKTRVVRTYPQKLSREEKVIVQNDDAGIEYVYQFLKEKGFIKND